MMQETIQRTITPEDIHNFKFVHTPNISPDGKFILFTVSRTKNDNEYSTSIWKYSIETRELKPIVDVGYRTFSPKWSPDANHILYLAAAEGGLELWVCDSDGNDRKNLVSVRDRKLIDPKWSKDGKRVYFISDWDHDAEKKSSDVKVITRRFYRFDGEGYQHDRRTHVFRVDLEGSGFVQLTSGAFDVPAFDISPDGSEVALIANTSKDADLQNSVDIFVIPSTGGSLRRIHSNKGPIASISYSPDGKCIAFTGDDYRFKFNTPVEVWLLDLSTGKTTNISHDLDRPARNAVGSDVSMDGGDVPPTWCGTEVFFVATDRGRCNIFAANIESRKVRSVTSGNHLITSFGISNNGIIAYIKMDPIHLPELFLLRQGSNEEQVTNFNKEFLGNLKLSSPQEFTFKARDGIEIHGFVFLPTMKKWDTPPCIVQVHGGGGAEGFQFMHEFQCQAAQGFAVLTCNFRGTQGYGEDYMRILTGHYMEKDYSDIVDMVKHALSEGWIDRKRIGITGGSYGGYLTNWSVTHDDLGLFAAAVTDRSVVNLYSFYGTSDDYRLIEEDVQESFPWDRPEHYISKSPIGHTKNVHTPLLIIHSEEDYRCPLEQAEQLFAFLKRQGKEVVLVVFPKESHGLSRGGKPHHRIERLLFGLWWFTSHIETGSMVKPPVPPE